MQISFNQVLGKSRKIGKSENRAHSLTKSMPPSFWAWRVVRRIQMRHAGSTRITMKEASAAWSRVRVRVRLIGFGFGSGLGLG